MSMNFTVGRTHENIVLWSLYMITAVSFPIDKLTIYLILTKTPKHIGSYKYLMLGLQIFSALIEVHIGALFAPVPLFPLIGCYCEGILCRMRLPPHYCIVFYFLILDCLTIQNLCVFYRHQAVLSSDHPLKIRKRRYRVAICLMYTISLESMCILAAFSRYESSGWSDYLEQHLPAMLWLIDKPSWIVYDLQSSTKAVIYNVIIGLTILIPLFFGIISHIFVVLNERSLCWLVICVPAAIVIASVLTEVIPHALTSIAFLVSQLFSLLSATTAILNSPTFRSHILRCIHLRTPPETPKWSSASPKGISSVSFFR